MSVLQKEDWRGVVDLFTNAKQVVSSVQDVARRLADYAKLRSQTKHSGMFMSIGMACTNSTFHYTHKSFLFVNCRGLWGM